MRNFSDIVEEIKKIKKLKTDQEVAVLFDWPRQTINNYKRENRIPLKHLVDFCEKENVSFDELVLGREPNKASSGSELKEIKKRLAALEKKNKK